MGIIAFYDVLFIEEPVDFVRHLQDQTLTDIPNSVTFECELTKADVKIQWQFGNTVLSPGDRYTITMEGTVHRLTIADATGDDVEQYTATARGKTSQAKLVVQGNIL